MPAPRAAILDCAGPVPSPDECAFFRDADPWGFIVFARHVRDPAQLSRLTGELREAVGRDAPILVDQEGGRVARLRGPHWRDWPRLPDLVAALPPEGAARALGLQFGLIAHELRAVGLDVNCMPIADVAGPGTHPIIADRALGTDPVQVAANARAVAEALLAGGVLPVLKHLPGHGAARADSHLTLPTVDAPLDALRARDFAAFRPLADLPLGMTAHVVYPALDPEAPATLSPACIAASRDDIGFDGLLMTDDMAMGALTGPMGARARDALAAGCDMLLLCNSDRADQAALLAETPRLSGRALTRAEAALAARRPPAPFDPAEAEAALAALLPEGLRRAAHA